MSALQIRPVKTSPEFDMLQFMEISGLTRLEHGLLQKLEASWKDWTDRVMAFRLAREGGQDGYLLVFLPPKVEELVEEGWDASQEEGEALHNLAVTLVMAAAQSANPRLLETGCIPLARPGQAVQEVFEKLDLEWNPTTASLNRQYALFTPDPYRGGCEVCYQADVCPNSTVRGR